MNANNIKEHEKMNDQTKVNESLLKVEDFEMHPK